MEEILKNADFFFSNLTIILVIAILIALTIIAITSNIVKKIEKQEKQIDSLKKEIYKISQNINYQTNLIYKLKDNKPRQYHKIKKTPREP